MKQFLIYLVLAGALIYGCRKSTDNIPRVPVNEYINLSLPTYNSLNIAGNWIYYQGGNRGLIVYKISDGNFAAFERTCPYDPSVTNSIIYGIPNNVFGIDSVCGSKFSLIDGNVIKGPATHALLQYQTSLDGIYLHIYN